MNNSPPMSAGLGKVDADHLKLLSIFHFVVAGLALLGIFGLLAHYALFHAFFANPAMWANQKQNAPPPEFFALFKWFYLFLAVWFSVSILFNVVSGFCLRARKFRTFSILVAGLNCLHVPLGTVLGVFTIIVLLRDSVRESYESGTASLS